MSLETEWGCTIYAIYGLVQEIGHSGQKVSQILVFLMYSALGARFGPRAIRAASARQSPYRGFNHRAGLNPYQTPVKLLDCGDIPISPFSSTLALEQMTAAYSELMGRKPQHSSLDYPRLVTLGGDHSIALPVLRALNDLYGEPISVLHFDAHLDTWAPSAYPGSAWDPDGEMQAFNHGSMFWLAGKENLIARNSSVHAGLRTRLGGAGWSDFEDDEKQGWMRIVCDEIDEIGVKGIVQNILDKMGTTKKVYVSVDIDVVDPGLAPGTGSMSCFLPQIFAVLCADIPQQPLKQVDGPREN